MYLKVHSFVNPVLVVDDWTWSLSRIPVADLGSVRDACSPQVQNFFIFMQFSGKIGQKKVGAPLRGRLSLIGKFWVRHWIPSFLTILFA